MECLRNIETYFEMINSINKEFSPTYTNCYLSQGKAGKLIEEKRLYYEKVNGGLLLYLDQNRYYEMYYYLNLNADWSVNSQEKDIVIKNIYVENRKNRKLIFLEEKIKSSGFYLLDTLKQVGGDVDTILLNLQKSYNQACNIMQMYGFSLVELDETLLPQIREFEEHIKEIPIYQIPYFEDCEIRSLGKEGRAVGIVDADKKLCAMKFFFDRDLPYGYFAVKKEYQKMFGMAIVLSYYSLKYLKEKQIKLANWIELNNNKSIEYHLKLGYRWMERCTDEWILKSN